MMASLNGNIFSVTVPLCWEFTGHWWIPLKKASDAELWCFLWSACVWTNVWVNNRNAGDLRRHRDRCDVTVKSCQANSVHFYTIMSIWTSVVYILFPVRSIRYYVMPSAPSQCDYFRTYLYTLCYDITKSDEYKHDTYISVGTSRMCFIVLKLKMISSSHCEFKIFSAAYCLTPKNKSNHLWCHHQRIITFDRLSWTNIF